ncbi:hypothetical protein GCM10025738_25980 [Microbacterium fluvii]
MRDVLGLRNPYLYGNPGQAQQGIDILAVDAHGSWTALQSKKYVKFTTTDLRKAVETFRDADRPFQVDRLILGVSVELRETRMVLEFARLQEALEPVRLELWDAQRLSELLRDRPEIVVQYFGEPTARGFCGDFEIYRPQIADADALAISDAIARSPETVTGARPLLDKAENTSDPETAIGLVELAQAALRTGGFSAHASRHEPTRADLLVKLGREREATRQLLDETWAALDRGRTTNAQVIVTRLETLVSALPDAEAVADHTSVASRALEIYVHPLGLLPDPGSLRIGEVDDQIRLLLLAGETALALDDTEWLESASTSIAGIRERGIGDPLQDVRLRLLLAESTGDWGSLLEEARRRKLRPDVVSLVFARRARYCAIREQFHEADAHWEEAAATASLARKWDDAGAWVLSKRAFYSHWQPFNGSELVPLEMALDEMGPSSRVVPRSLHAYEDALDSLRQGNHRTAAIAAKRALRDAVAAGDWAAERRSHIVFAAVLQASNEPEVAAAHFARAGATKEIVALSEAYQSRFIDAIDGLHGGNYWTVGATYRLLAAQEDLVPDDKISAIASQIVTDLRAADERALTDLAVFSTSRYAGAVKALAGIADRITESDADETLSHFERQPPIQENHYRTHDDDEAVAVAKIAIRHPSLAIRAVPHLVELLARADRARQPATLDVLDRYPELAREALKATDGRGKDWATEMLALADPDEISPDDAAAAVARLTTPLLHTPGMYTVGTRAVGDSLLLSGQPPAVLSEAVTELLRRAGSRHVSASDRGQYLVAAANVAQGMDEVSRSRLFAEASRLVETMSPSDPDLHDAKYSHPLSAFRIMVGHADARGEAVYLASILATDSDQRAIVRRLAYALLGSGSDEYYATRALQQLGASMKDDVAFLAGQGWAMRCLASDLWVKHGGPQHVGARLASDGDVRVREALARALAAASPEPRQEAIREVLATDPSFRVRRAIGS